MKINKMLGALLGFFAVLLGAFGAHALKKTLDPTALNSFETGVRYMMYHALVILIINNYTDFTNKLKNILTSLFFIGILFFSGSIFAISVIGISAKNIWYITPLGGLLLICGWGTLVISFIVNIKRKN